VKPPPTRRQWLQCAAAAALLAAASSAGADTRLEELIVAAKPSVVAIGVFNATNNPRFGFRGTGFAVGSGNLVVTNLHVLPEAVPAGGSDGSLVVVSPRQGSADRTGGQSAKVLAVDREHDLALLRVDGAPLPPLELAETPSREGASIAIIGFPIGGALGFSAVTHRGIIASVTGIAMPAPTAQALNSQTINRLRTGSFDIYQLDATAYPGNSGGPVLDVETGKVVAVINMVLVKGSRESAITHPSGISYAIPVRFVSELLKGR
jgi:S1-C subfamily serine protease